MSQKILDKARIDFKSGVPEVLFRSVNAQCSVPRCKKPTTGPFAELVESVNMGVACHIYSAAAGGPRGQGGKSKSFIESAENGIWCCQYHAALIDKKKGNDYPAATLFAWKNLAEARVRKQMNDIPSPLGWVESIEYLTPHRSNLPPPKIQLSRYTILTGANGSGKTSLLEAAAAICNSKYFDRIASAYTVVSGMKVGVTVEAKATYTTVDTFSKEIHIAANNFVIRRKDGKLPCLLPPGDIEVIFCSEEDARKRDDEDDFRFLMRALNVDASALRELIDIGPSVFLTGQLSLQHEIEEDEHQNKRIRCDDYGNEFFEIVLTRVTGGQTFDVAYNGLSSSEKRRLLLALSLTKAREVAKQKLTLLAIEYLANNFDEKNFENLLTSLKQEDFQVLISMPPVRETTITEVVDERKQLKNLHYLEDWTLREL
ncbi:MAG: hypothetical protein ACXV4B_02620 [Halobacteriota archaeon]